MSFYFILEFWILILYCYYYFYCFFFRVWINSWLLHEYQWYIIDKNTGVLTSVAVLIWVTNKAISTIALESVVDTLADGIETTRVWVAHTDTDSLPACFMCCTVWIFMTLWLYTWFKQGSCYLVEQFMHASLERLYLTKCYNKKYNLFLQLC